MSEIERTEGSYEAGDVVLQSGLTYRGLRIGYATYGKLNARRDNAILFPTSYGATHLEQEFMIRRGGALDPERYFIVIPNLFGNGISSSPSTSAWPHTGPRYPHTTLYDAVHVQQRMLAELWDIQELALVYGFSMGAMQAYHWAALFPQRVKRIAVVCGAARCSAYNRLFIDAASLALTADAAWQDGEFRGFPQRGFRAMGRVYAAAGLSQDFYREEAWRLLGASSLEDYLIRFWEGHFSRRDPADLLAQFWSWQRGDISANDRYHGDFEAALRAIEAEVLLMPCDHDMYFRVADSEIELAHLRNGRLRPISSIWGHRAGNPNVLPAERAWIEAEVTALLGRG
ncbi:hypothetical protein CAL29_27410 [Bordetella genomosp. 10]|uniref:AB hydrolase-1 domain-containing protein n=1 Tax=Bordetella genomosp. 10 TaxID=1416804 RepID=A0A261S2M5_9BORD|nr:alpha/beta fold hydrolase [Bordetella genomosp. 10]OZI31614.1 hypothetical protein CAL29_27410 [Bordetella genomosp. 10]